MVQSINDTIYCSQGREKEDDLPFFFIRSFICYFSIGARVRKKREKREKKGNHYCFDFCFCCCCCR